MRFLPLFHNHYTSVILPLRDAAVHTSPPHHHHDLQDVRPGRISRVFSAGFTPPAAAATLRGDPDLFPSFICIYAFVTNMLYINEA